MRAGACRGACTAFAAIAMVSCATPPVEPPAVVGAVFEVRRADAVGYLVASAHSGFRQKIAVSDRVRSLVEGAGVVAFEALPDEARPPSARRRPVAAYGRATSETLESELGPELTVRIRQLFAERNAPNGAWEALGKMRLPFVGTGIVVAVGIGQVSAWQPLLPEANPGMDALIFAEAVRAGRALGELETEAEVVRSRLRLTREEAVAEIEQLVRRMESLPAGQFALADTLVARFLVGDLEKAYADYREQFCPPPVLARVCDKTVDDRNEDMATKFAALVVAGLRPVGVTGAMHLAGPAGIPAQLRQRGFAVRRLEP